MTAAPIRHLRGELQIEGVSARQIARRFGTPCYVYSRAAIERAYLRAARALAGFSDSMICYAVKANGNLSILRLLGRWGAGFDVVSGGELARATMAGGDAGKIVFSGPGKTDEELIAAARAGVFSINVESEGEFDRLSRIARKTAARMMVRFAPDVDAKTHPHLTTGLARGKFGLDFDRARALARRAAAAGKSGRLSFVGVSCHIGSQVQDPDAYAQAAARVEELLAALESDGVRCAAVDVGGGFAARCDDETPLSIARCARHWRRLARGRKIVVEPGRSLLAAAGVLLTRVVTVKEGETPIAVVDGGMNDFLRPALYGARHRVESAHPSSARRRALAVAGPVCESADFWSPPIPLAAAAGDLLAARDVGAYGFSMASNYNARPRPCEVMVAGARATAIRRRETFAEMTRAEIPAPRAKAEPRGRVELPHSP